MKLKFNWINRNTDEDGTRVYRSDVPTTTIEGLTAIATLPTGANEFEDDTVTQGKTYYYFFESFKGDDTYLSNPVVALATPYTGAGSQQMIQGDFGRGYFGTVDGAVFITPQEVVERVDLSKGTVPETTSPQWHKFAHNGNIYFVSSKTARRSISWDDLYGLGLVFGVDGPGPIPDDVTPVNQNKVITVNGDEYQVMTMGGLNDDVEWADIPLPAGTYSDESIDSMWTNTIMAVITTFNDESQRGKLSAVANSDSVIHNEVMREISPTKQVYRRTSALARTLVASNATGEWRCVLRLVP